ncbi:hypothetical protein CHELA40_13578 [Chelatococcus asaccharovorans]|nr:hypothetical protein CHELA40_13578 [Chelatococcus asaccharovorans]CAH1677059.1 hypothetical protein CHELA17_62044 [Chelatococcus asaccharovorans]
MSTGVRLGLTPVIPGRRIAAGPESMNTVSSLCGAVVVMDSLPGPLCSPPGMTGRDPDSVSQGRGSPLPGGERSARQVGCCRLGAISIGNTATAVLPCAG